jgi:hypothetical protein
MLDEGGHPMSSSRLAPWIVVASSLASIVGCAGPSSGTTSNVETVGDQQSIALDDVVAVSRMRDGAIRNVHVRMTAIVNSADGARRDFMSASTSKLQGFVRRMEPRLRAVVVDTILKSGDGASFDSTQLRADIRRDVHTAFQAEFKRFDDAAEWSIEFVVTDLFVTDGSVGR